MIQVRDHIEKIYKMILGELAIRSTPKAWNIGTKTRRLAIKFLKITKAMGNL